MNGKHQKESSQLPIQTILFGREVASSRLPGSALDSNPEIFSALSAILIIHRHHALVVINLHGQPFQRR
jgi:hypothetical protein